MFRKRPLVPILSALLPALLLPSCHPDRAPAGPKAAPAAAAPTAPALAWPIPPGWRHETIPFPLDFAPELPYRGVEELRFPPGFFKKDAPDRWSYAFAWWLERPADVSPPALSRWLAQYFIGLSEAVGKGKYTFDRARFAAHLVPAAGSTHLGHPTERVRGPIETYDPFVTGEPVSLHAEIATWYCPVSGRQVVLVAASPQPREAPIWTDLDALRTQFRCHAQP